MVVNYAEVDLSEFYPSYFPVDRASRVAPFIYCSLNDSIAHSAIEVT